MNELQSQIVEYAATRYLEKNAGRERGLRHFIGGTLASVSEDVVPMAEDWSAVSRLIKGIDRGGLRSPLDVSRDYSR